MRNWAVDTKKSFYTVWLLDTLESSVQYSVRCSTEILILQPGGVEMFIRRQKIS